MHGEKSCRAALSRTLDSRSLYLSARRPISVVHTGVKSAGWLNRMAHLPSIHSCLQQENEVRVMRRARV